jgi:DNA polymerase-1
MTAAASLPPPGTERVLYLVDLSGYVFRAYHAIAPLSSSRGEPTHAVLGTVNMLQKVVNERKPHLLAVAMDSRSARSFRKDIDPRYKATRPAPPPDLGPQMKRCEEIVRAYNIPVYQKDGIEADDLIASVAKRASKEGVRVVIVSADKDMMQIVHDDDDTIVLWDSMRDRVYGPKEVEEKFGVRPSQVRDLLALTGDTSDNVPGVPSVGPKTAADLLREFGTLDGIYQNLDKVKRPKLREALEKNEADARLSQRLVTLDEESATEWSFDHLVYGGANDVELRRLFLELEFTRLLGLIAAPKQVARTFRLISNKAELEALAARAREKKSLALWAAGSGTDPNRAALIGLALSPAPGDGAYLPISHRYLGAPKQVTLAELREVLGPLLVDPRITKLGHELDETEILLARHDLPIRGPIFDTLITSWLLDPEAPNDLSMLAKRELDVNLPVAEAAKKGKESPLDSLDVEAAKNMLAPRGEAVQSLADRIAPRLEAEGLAKLWHEVEAPLARVLAQIELEGVLVDTSRLQTIGRRAEEELRALEAKAKAVVGHDFILRSRDQLETILFDELKLPVLKKTSKGGRSTDAEVLEELAVDHELPRVLLEFREIDKLKGTYVDALPRFVNEKTGRIHTRFHQAGAATGRLASSDPNLQNIPIRTPLGREIRSAFVAPKGHLLLSADYSQIELRVLAHLSQDPMLLEAYRTNDDVHALTASVVFGVPRSEVTADMRRQAKTVNFGVIYGMGDNALARQLGIEKKEATRFIENYFTRYQGVARFMAQTVEAAKKGEAVRTMLGRRRFLPNLHSANRALRFEAERIAKNTPIQGTAADILKVAMVRLGQDPPPGTKMILTVHDELVFEVEEARAEEAKARVREVMESSTKLDVPLLVEAGTGASWDAAH